MESRQDKSNEGIQNGTHLRPYEYLEDSEYPDEELKEHEVLEILIPVLECKLNKAKLRLNELKN